MIILKRLISGLILLTVFLLSAVTGYSYTDLTHMYYDDYSGRLYVYTLAEKTTYPFRDAGVYINGEKYSLIKEESDKEKLDGLNSSDEARYGIALETDMGFFDNLPIMSYTVDENGKEIIGNPRKFDIEEKSINTENTVYFENFTDYSLNEMPKNISFNTTRNTNTSAKLVKAKDENGIEKNMLLLDDLADAGVVIANFALPEYSEVLMLEIKLKCVKQPETPGFGLVFDYSGNGNRAFRLIKYADTETDGFTFVASGSYNISGKDKSGEKTPFDDEWVTIKFRIDSNRKINQVLFENDFYKTADIDTVTYPYMWQNKAHGTLLSYNLLCHNEFEDEKIDSLALQTYKKSYGKYYIDYVKIVTDVDEFKIKKVRAPSKPIETIPDPVENW